jgi:hypothetical protein
MIDFRLCEKELRDKYIINGTEMKYANNPVEIARYELIG